MARSRNIKPSFFINEDLVELPFSTRLLFIGLWTIADREGRLDDKPKQIKMAIFPADDVDVDAGLCELADEGFIERYEVKGDKYIQIINFTKHQSPHVKEVASTRPAPGKHRTSTRRAALNPITESKTDSPFLNPHTEPDVCEPTKLSFAEQVLDGIRDELGITQLTHEPLWLIEIERAEKNKFTVDHCLETFRLMRQQKWRKGPIKAETWSENLPNLDNLRNEITEQMNGTNKPTSEREKSANRNIEQEQLANDIRAGKYDEAVERLFSRDGDDNPQERILRQLPGAH